MKANILKNSFLNSTGFVFTAAITFFITPFVVHRLGNELYGIWVLVIGLTGYLGLLDFGMRTAIVKYVSEYHAKEDYAELNGMSSTALTLFATIGLICWLIAVLFSFFMEDVFNVGTVMQINFFVLLLIIGADVFLTFSFMIFQGSIAGFQRYDISVRNGLIAFSLRSVLILLLLGLGYGIVALSIIVLVSNLLGYFLNFKSCRSICPQLCYSIGKISRKHLHTLWQYSWKSFVTNISDRIIYYSDTIIIGIFLDPEHITFYAIASSLIIYTRQLILSISGVFVPAISSAHANGAIADIHQIVVEGSKLILFVLIPIFCILAIMGQEFIRLWMGPGYEETYQVLFILLISQFLVLSQYGVTLVLYGLAKHEVLAHINMVIAALNVILSVILVQYWGIIGVALGSAIPLALLRILLIPKRVFKLINMKFGFFYKEIILRGSLVFLLYIVVLLCLKHTIDASTWFGFISISSISLMVYLVIFYLVGLKTHERSKIVVFILSQLKKMQSLYQGGICR